MNNVPPHKRGIGMVFQNYALFPHMSVYENLAFPLKLESSMNAVKTRVEKVLEMVELMQFGSRRLRSCPAGSNKEALARALVFEPDLVLMDEPWERWIKI